MRFVLLRSSIEGPVRSTVARGERPVSSAGERCSLELRPRDGRAVRTDYEFIQGEGRIAGARGVARRAVEDRPRGGVLPARAATMSDPTPPPPPPPSDPNARSERFPCQGCGAPMRWDPSVDALFCDYCGATLAVPR
jgi:hypothetical protein